jgi:hypothetical protein
VGAGLFLLSFMLSGACLIPTSKLSRLSPAMRPGLDPDRLAVKRAAGRTRHE